MPTVSVIMLFHRITPFLRPAIDSVLTQTFTDLELVLVDNGTGTEASFFGADPRIRIVRLPTNLGIAGGANAGIQSASGEFIALLDYDDIALPRRLERQVEALRADPGLALVSSCAEQIDAEGKVIGREFALTDETEQRAFVAYSNPAPAPSFTGRVEYFRRFPRRPDVGLADDYDFFSRVADVGRMRGLPEVLLHYRCHPGQTTSAQHTNQVLSACIVRLLTARRGTGRPEEFTAVIERVRAWMASARSCAEIYRYFSRWALADGHTLLAVYLARKSLSESRDARTCWSAVSILQQALARRPADASLLLRMFFTGPLRTHRLHPA